MEWIVSVEQTRDQVRSRYARSAIEVDSGCCSDERITGDSYATIDLSVLPDRAAAASLGCGNPTAIAELGEGERVLDLGSGGGIDVILSARRVGPSGFVYGLDMTAEMLELARQNAAEAGLENVEFLEGYIEDIPLDSGTIDVILSNCVINLSPDKRAVFAEMMRVLRPGGRLAVTDVVAEDRLSPAERAERGSWVGCIAGALSVSEYTSGLEQAGFEQISLSATHSVADGLHSMIITARRPTG